MLALDFHQFTQHQPLNPDHWSVKSARPLSGLNPFAPCQNGHKDAADWQGRSNKIQHQVTNKQLTDWANLLAILKHSMLAIMMKNLQVLKG